VLLPCPELAVEFATVIMTREFFHTRHDFLLINPFDSKRDAYFSIVTLSSMMTILSIAKYSSTEEDNFISCIVLLAGILGTFFASVYTPFRFTNAKPYDGSRNQ
jgi:hypothetical protein